MAVSNEALLREVRELRQEMDAIRRGNRVSGTVVSSNSLAGTVEMLIVNPDGTSIRQSFPVASNFVPAPGSTAVVHMNGTDPLVIPLQGEQVQVDGGWLRSPNYVPGVSGWKIDGDGSAEFNNVIVRGTLAAGALDSLTATSFTLASSLLTTYSVPPNLNFDVNATGWAGSGCTLSRVTTPVQAGAGALAITCTGTTGWIANTPTGTSGVPAIPGAQYQVTYFCRTAATSRPTRMIVRFYDAAGAWIQTWHVGDEGELVTTGDSTSYFSRTARATAPANAAYYALYYVGTASANGEIHYLDSISITVAPGYCPDANLLGATFADTNNTSTGTLPNGYVGTETNGSGATAAAFADANFGGTLLVTPGLAYSVEVDAVISDRKIGLRTYASWYDSTGALIRTDFGKLFYTDSALSPSPPGSGEFNAPANAHWGFFGLGSYSRIDNGGSATFTVGSLNVYRTTNFNSGFIAPEVMWSGSQVVPPGAMMAYAGVAADVSGINGVDQVLPGWLTCDGRAVSRTRWSDLFAAIGTIYGAGDGSTTFNLPDVRGRTIFASDGQGGTLANRINAYASGVGTVGGEDQHTLNALEMPIHAHGIAGGSGAAGFGGGFFTGTGAGQASGFQGGGGAHENMPPFITMHWFIKT